jgi:hypothetical protein
MRGYGRDYEHRNFIERAGDTVQRWFGGGRDYDRDYGMAERMGWHQGGGTSRGGMDRDWADRGGMGMDRWSGSQGGWGGEMGGRDWSDRDRDWQRRTYIAGHHHGMDRGGMRGGMTDRDRDDRGSMMGGGGTDYDRDYDRGFSGRNMGGGYYGGGSRYWGGGTGYQGGGSGVGDGYLTGGRGELGGDNDQLGWGDYNRGGYGGSLFRNSRGGGVEPGRHFRGYGHGTGGNYDPY